ncbi:hypothetical protein [Pseudomonas alloputida]|uniref:hypothetical protein n=1 Tax=Pseudomonas TaxID=286 RepID=UPI003EE90E83
MSVIVIVVEQDEVSASMLMKLRRVLGVSLQLLKGEILSRNPIIELEVFDGEYQQHAELIRTVIALLDAEKIKASYYEIPYGQKYSGNQQLSLWKVNSSLIEGILVAADNEVRRQHDI